jgi:hypothetical protein
VTILLFVMTVLLAGCANPRLSDPNARKSTSSDNRDVSDCEREAALASAGSKAQAFDNCMRARNQTPK